jgi:hypothetical protein
MNILALEILDNDQLQMHVSGTNGEKIKLFVHVWGLFPTSGWTKPNLVQRAPRLGIEPTATDYFAEFNFFAEQPTAGTVVLDALTPLLCEAVIDLPNIVHGVRVHGQKNAQEKLVRFSSLPSGNPKSDGNDFIPIPWISVTRNLGET